MYFLFARKILIKKSKFNIYKVNYFFKYQDKSFFGRSGLTHDSSHGSE